MIESIENILRANIFKETIGKAKLEISPEIVGIDIRQQTEDFRLKSSPFGIDFGALINLDFDTKGTIQHIEILEPPPKWIKDTSLSIPTEGVKDAILYFEKVKEEIDKGEKRWISIDDLNIVISTNPHTGVVKVAIGENEENNYYRLAEEIVIGIGKESGVLKEIWARFS